jgi:hypothetical protein
VLVTADAPGMSKLTVRTKSGYFPTTRVAKKQAQKK